MKKNLLRFSSLALAALLVTSSLMGCQKNSQEKGTNSTAATSKNTDAQKPKEATVSYLHCWNGGGSTAPQDIENNVVAQKIREKTGVTVKIQSITTNETEKLNMIFASGELPDIINAPYWSSESGEGKVIVKAAKEGMLLALDGLVDKYPNVQRGMTQGVAPDFKQFDLEHKDFGGKHYLIPQQTPRSDKDIYNWAYNVFARKDILDALKIKPEEITGSEQVYELLKKIKAGNFKDINGKPVIPGGAWHNGWSYSQFLASFSKPTMTDFRIIDGKVTHYQMDPLEEKKILFMRKLINEGLFDPECLTQNDSVAKEKMATGRVAVFGAHYKHQSDFFKSTLYKTNPEMKFVPLGPMINAAGEPKKTLEMSGRSGFPAMFLSAKTKNADAALRFIDYVNSDEGLKLVAYGVEGTHYTMVNGKPEFTPEWKAKKDKDQRALYDQGIGFYENFITADPRQSLWNTDAQDADYQIANQKNPIKFVTGFRASYIARSYPKYQEYKDKEGILKYDFKNTLFAKTDEEAIAMLNDYRDKLRKAGLDDLCKYIEEEAKKRNDVIW